MEMGWVRSIFTGAIAGVVWGWIAMAINSATGIFPFEGSFAHDLVTFSIGGAVFGVVVSGFLKTAGEYMPFKGAFAKAVFTSTLLWLLLRVGGAALSSMEPSRYHVLTPQTLQGLGLAVVFGALLGMFWGKEPLSS